MTEGRNQVKDVQKHLRRAGELIAQQHFAAALIEIDAALAIDRGSLAALALRERIVQAPTHPPAASPPQRSAGESDRRRAPVAPPAADTRFVPPGVDAQSWLGFEQRIQDRRFGALLQTINTAIATDDGIAARIALEEARELRPGAPELEAVADRIALLPMALPAESGGYLRSRASGAVALLLAGVALLIGLDRVRSDDPIRAPQSITDPDNRRLSNPDPIPSDPSAAPVAAVPDLVPSPALVAAPEPSATTGTVSSSTDEPALPTPGPVNRSADVVDARAASNEIPDDLVTERPRREADAPVRASSVESGVAATRPRSVPSATPASTPPVTPPALPPGTAASSSLARSAPATAATPPAPANTADTSEVAATTPVTQRPDPSQAASTPASRSAGTQGTQTVSRDIVAATAEAGELAPAPPPSVAASSAVVTIPDETGGVAQVLDQYARAYTQLDARAARAIWPSVDERGLARAFGQLESQAVSFDDCEISVRGARADASCHGHTSFVGKVGSREERTEARSWRFQLRRDGEAWMIQSAEAR